MRLLNANAAGSRISNKRGGGVNDLSANHCEKRFDSADFFDRNGHVILRQDSEVGEFSDCERASFVLVAREPCTAERVEAQGFQPTWSLLRPAQRNAADRLAVEKPLERGKRIIRSHAMRV